MAVYDEAGRGRKQCPSCHKYVGIRSSTCTNCNTAFPKSEPKKDEPKKAEKPVKVEKVQKNVEVAEEDRQSAIESVNNGVILTPAGACPVRLTGTEPNEVLDWQEKVVASFEGKGKSLAATGVAYFVRQFYAISSPEYQKVIAVLGK